MISSGLMWSLTVLLLQVIVLTKGDYIVEVRTINFSNPQNRVHRGQCCDPLPTNSTICGQCDISFFYCLKPLGVSTDCDGGLGSNFPAMDGEIDFSSDLILGLQNPLPLTGLTTEWKGVQVYIDVFENDETTRPRVIDVYAIDVPNSTLSLGIESSPVRSGGIENFAFLEVSFRVVCAANYFGQDCTRFCTKNCTCDPGFSGEFCHIRNEVSAPCSGVDCGTNGQCVENSGSFSCVCEPGYSGERCNESCAAVNNCSGHGQCVLTDLQRGTECTCDPGYTGRQCEVERGDPISSCVINNVTCNGNGRCISSGSSHVCLCDNGFTGTNCEVSTEITTNQEPMAMWFIIGGAVGGSVIVIILAAAVFVTIFTRKKLKKIRNTQPAQRDTGPSNTEFTSSFNLSYQSSTLTNGEVLYSTNVSYGVIGPHTKRNLSYGIEPHGPEMTDDDNYEKII